MRANEAKFQVIHLESREEDNNKIKVCLKLPLEYGWIENVCFIAFIGNSTIHEKLHYISNIQDYAIFEKEVTLKKSAVYYYYFSFECNGKYALIKKANISGDNSITKEECYKLSGLKVPDWVKGAIMYHIFVDRFARDNSVPLPVIKGRIIKKWNEKVSVGPINGLWNIDFYGGNLKGIINRLDYIQSLGVNIIYLSPIMASQSNHRYDTADYEQVDVYAGSNNDLVLLCEEAHKRNIKIILDAVFNHTGNDSKYFNQYGTYAELGAYQSQDSKYYKFYKRVWRNGTRNFSFWWDMKNLPECDSSSKEWQDYILGIGGIIDQWFKFGIDGLRLDVADELSDEFIEKIRYAVHRNKEDGLIIGEVWENPMRKNRGFLSSGKGMDTVMNYLFIDALIRYYKYRDCWKLETTIKEIFLEYPNETIFSLMNFTSTHDMSRIIEIFGCDEFQKYGGWVWDLTNNTQENIENHKMSIEEYRYGKKMLKSFITVLAMFPGIFSIFYGDEVGMQGIGNLANRGPFPWENVDLDLLEFFRKICKIRNDNEFLKIAEYNTIKIDDRQFMFERFSENEKFLIVVSRTHHYSKVNIPENYNIEKIIFGNSNLMELEPYGIIIAQVKIL